MILSRSRVKTVIEMTTAYLGSFFCSYINSLRSSVQNVCFSPVLGLFINPFSRRVWRLDRDEKATRILTWDLIL